MTKNKSVGDARAVATTVLYRVQEEGAWATPTLDAELRAQELDSRDAALATQLVYGALRVLPSLDACIEKHLKRPKLDAWVRAALRVGAYQIMHLERVPPRAAVFEAVALVRSQLGPAVGGFTNAVMRKIAAERPEKPEPPTELEAPKWARKEMVRSLGDERAKLLWRTGERGPALGLRVNGKHSVAEVVASIRATKSDAEVFVSDVLPRAIAVRGAGDLRALPEFNEGAFTVQEWGAQITGAYVDVHEGACVADICAGHGGKTLMIAEKVGSAGKVVAVDLYEEKLEALERDALRLGLDARIETAAVDFSVGSGGLEPTFDHVLVDAPCTGLGTVLRRPEILFRLKPRDLKRMARLQLKILQNAAALVCPGGTLTYVVCSPARAEGIEVAQAFAENADFEPMTAPCGRLPEADADGVYRIGPWSGLEVALDAYQVLRWRRRTVA